ncbi:uncharacterized protein C4orf54 homolog [Paramormyrops kingsleyae]|uniref:uncharacterized protein C4orf54 homolog n=1 Tax=Paramormyrops kingsleyae TaxID=1676925 RepID=UPI003B97C89A
MFDSMAQQDESNYVDLNGPADIKADGAKTVKVTFTGEGNQLAVFKRSSDSHSTSGDQTTGDHEPNDVADLPAANCGSINEKDVGGDKADEILRDTTGAFQASSSCEIPDKSFRDCLELSTGNGDAVPGSQLVPRKFNPEIGSINKEALQYSDMYISRKGDPVEGVGVLLSYHRMPSATDDESHYITTHEIQLSELDHDADYDFETGSCWDIEDNNLACSFIDYASFDSEEKLGAGQEKSLERVESNQVHANNTDRRATGGAAVSTKPENDLCDMNKCVSSDESLSKNQNGSGNCAGQIHLSIKATSRTINEPSGAQEKENIRCYAKHQGDMSRHVFRRADKKAEKICDSAKCFIAAPGRLHFGTKIKGKDINEYSSGASSAVSELDDADKEVRNLTARAFKSLACPYFDAINFSTSSESSASEHGLGINGWSAFVDLKYDMTRAREKNLVSHKSATISAIDKNAGKAIKGLPLANIKAPQTKIFGLNGNLSDPKNASSSTKKMEVMGTFGKGRRGVITLTETLNFRCNVQAGVPGGERRAKFAQNATGSRSGDEVTCVLPSRRGGEASRQPCNAEVSMEGAHKKAIFATSLLKNVISKKMQFEQERKMERGEICEPPPALSPCCFFKDHEMHKEKGADGARSLQRQTSKFSEAGSDLTVVCLDDLADLGDNNSCDPKDDIQREDTLTLASGTNLEPTNEAGFNTKKGAFEASKSTLLRSQNSAFRSWKDGEQHFEKEHKSDKTPAGRPHSSTGKLGKTDVEIEVGGSRLTKMSHLFVPSIHVMSEERGTGKQLPNMKYSTRTAAHQTEEDKVRLDNTLYVADTARSVVTSKSPEIKISLRSVKDSKGNPFNIAKLLTPNIGCNATGLIKTADDSKCQAHAVSLKGDAAEKVPHFMVRDIRDNKSKLQTPIHQVRDVRKLVKSSYHFSSDANESKTAAASDVLAEHSLPKPGPSRNPSSVSPIVIKCQSVNTNSNVKRSGNLIEVPKRRPADITTEWERLSPQVPTEGADSGPILVYPSASRPSLVTAKLLNGDPSEPPVEGKTEIVSSKRKQDKATDTSEKKPESKMANQAAFEKLQAAVKTMEQLYVFDRNEWKRKSEPQPITDSHVLSLIASEEHGILGKTESEEEDAGYAGSTEADVHSKHFKRSDSYSDMERSLASMSTTALLREDREQLKMLHIPFSWEEKDAPRSQSLQSGALGSKNAFTFTHSQKAAASGGSTRGSQACASSQTPFSSKTFAPKAAKETTSLKISHPKGTVDERETINNDEAENSVLANMSAVSNSENYLTIPVKSHAGDGKPAAAMVREQAVYTFTAARGQVRASSPSGQGESLSNASRHNSSSQSPKRSTVVMETRSADTPTATIYHHSIPMAQPQVICFSSAPVPPTPSDPFQPMQRKMLLDPTTGHYYLVDTPIQPATRRLFDPETGQYVDVPMPQPPVASLPMPMPPLALNPAPYGPAYMIYPSFLPGPPVMPARPPPTISVCAESEDTDRAPTKSLQGDVAYLEGPYYSPTGKALQAQQVTTRGTKGVTNSKPIISITSQQGPRIIAPPSFDGTTMSFVVEHR